LPPSCTWPAPPLRGGCCPPVSLAVARRRPAGAGSPRWAKAGVFDQLHLEVLDRLGEQGRLDWSRASVDTMSVRAKRGGPRWRKSGRPPMSTTPPCSKRSWLTCRRSARLWSTPDPARRDPRRQGLRQQHQPGLSAAAWDPSADRPSRHRILDAAGTPPLEDRAIAVVAELLAAATGAVGPGCGAVVRLRAAGLCGRVLQPALTSRRERHDV
jgi:hypothetical protein